MWAVWAEGARADIDCMKDSNTVIAERYEIERTLGEGAFATTYLALDRQTNRQCVV